MRTVTSLNELERARPIILTIGAFDGVHRGHQWLVRQVVDRARGLEYDSMVLTFEPRPQVILRPGMKQLTGSEAKQRIMAALGPDVLVLLPFSKDVAAVPAGSFLEMILEHINLREVWVGADFAFGHNREGNVDFLIRAGQRNRFGVHVVPRQDLGGTRISSTTIRESVGAGDVRQATALLGHYFGLPGPVVRGQGRGRALGFPTANVQPEPFQLLPALGIYAGYLRHDTRSLPAAISVGYNPVFGGKDIVVEAHVLDFDGDLYDQVIGLDFAERLRDEQNFSSVEALVDQIHRDVDQTRAVLAHAEQPGELILSA